MRVNPGEMITIGATCDGYSECSKCHCHILEHEDMDMMRPFVVAPAPALAAMGMADMPR